MQLERRGEPDGHLVNDQLTLGVDQTAQRLELMIQILPGEAMWAAIQVV